MVFASWDEVWESRSGWWKRIATVPAIAKESFDPTLLGVVSKRTLVVEEIRECKDIIVCATVKMVVMEAEEKYKNS
jgi:hypothetical protein